MSLRKLLGTTPPQPITQVSEPSEDSLRKG
jgi:hypothetical protein